MDKKGLLLINIGSPRSFQVADVEKYLKTFLMDRAVIDLPWIFRWPLVNLMIVPKRAPFSAKNYEKVWMPGGSPLIVYSKAFKEKLQEKLGPQFVVRTGMSFSSPNIEEALLDLVDQDIKSLLVAPMFPQYADATTGAVSNETKRLLKKHNIKIPVKFLQPFYNDPNFISDSVNIAKKFLEGKKVDHYLFSFHGLPEKQIQRNSFCELNDTCCKKEISCSMNCYRAQCLKNSELLAQALNLSRDQWSYSFQSRLGRAKWIGPSTDETLKKLAQNGTKNLAVLCPSFVADCIETLEEIGMGGKEDFLHAGGKEFHLVPCLNSDDNWARNFANLCAFNAR